MSDESAPHDLDAEAAVIGSIILDNEQLNRAPLATEDFYSDRHRMLWRAIQALSRSCSAVDIVTLSAELRKSGDDAKVGGDYISRLSNDTPAALNVGHYVQIVIEMSRRRRLRDLGRAIVSEATDLETRFSDILDHAQGEVTRISATHDAARPITLRQAFTTEMRDLEIPIDRSSSMRTGWLDLDRVMKSGLKPGNLIIIAGRPSMGKTALAFQLALNASKDGNPSTFVSLEMSLSEMSQRALSIESRVLLSKLVTHTLGAQDWGDLSLAVSNTSEAPLSIADPPSQTMRDIASCVRGEVRSNGTRLVVVDYLQLIKPISAKGKTREQEVSEISRGLKELAREQRIALVVVSQLNRDVEQRTNKRPMLSDLRESGAIEQDADSVWFLYRDEYYNPQTSDSKGVCEVNVAKQRNGGTDTIRLKWQGECCRFADLEENRHGYEGNQEEDLDSYVRD
jgi:replicative DNA helicase